MNLVIVGFGGSSDKTVAEVVDISDLKVTCSFNLNSPKFNGDGLGGALTAAGHPMVCGGGLDYNQCQVYSGGEWHLAPPLLVGAKFFGMSSSPFEQGVGSEILITGKTIIDLFI